MNLLYLFLLIVLTGCAVPNQNDVNPRTSPGMSVDAQDR